MGRSPVGEMGQRQLVAQLKALIDIASVRAPGQSKTQLRRSLNTINELIMLNEEALDRPYVRHNLGQRRLAWLDAYRHMADGTFV